MYSLNGLEVKKNVNYRKYTFILTTRDNIINKKYIYLCTFNNYMLVPTTQIYNLVKK